MVSPAGVVPETPDGAPEDGSPVGSLTELAALEAARHEKQELLDEAARAAVTERSTLRLPAGCSVDDLPALLHRYYWSEPAAEVVGHDPAELAGLALGHLKLAAVRPQGSATVDIQRLADGRAVIRMVTDDMPFLVDSVTAEVVRQGFDLQHIVHPVVVVRRDVTGRIKEFCDTAEVDAGGPDALSESWMAVVLDGPVDDESAADLVAGLRNVLTDVRAVHEDDQRMRTRALELAAHLETLAADQSAGAAGDPADDPAEAAALLRWLADGNFVFLGARDVRLTAARGKAVARALPGSGLGVLRSDTDQDPDQAAMPEAARTPEHRVLTVTKADARSTVHRPAWMDLIAVSLPGEDRGEPQQHRFVGLFSASAYTSSVLDVPLLRRRAAEVVARSGVPSDSHTGKGLLQVLETYPRDELFQVGTDDLLPVAMAVTPPGRPSRCWPGCTSWCARRCPSGGPARRSRPPSTWRRCRTSSPRRPAAGPTT
jgi:glutamate dehydrogenase